MKRKLCLALSAVMLAGSLAGCFGGTSGLPGDTSKASEAPAGKEAEGTSGELSGRTLSNAFRRLAESDC